jgi:hypothetical protein
MQQLRACQLRVCQLRVSCFATLALPSFEFSFDAELRSALVQVQVSMLVPAPLEVLVAVLVAVAVEVAVLVWSQGCCPRHLAVVPWQPCLVWVHPTTETTCPSCLLSLPVYPCHPAVLARCLRSSKNDWWFHQGQTHPECPVATLRALTWGHCQAFSSRRPVRACFPLFVGGLPCAWDEWVSREIVVDWVVGPPTNSRTPQTQQHLF